MITSGFTFYGSTASLIGADGQLETLWSALRINDNLHALYWNDTSLGQSSIILRNIAPSNPSD
ncbi:hypothetical protein BKA66DRAFT_475097 [Pyrenochaeta sp. MPI-SDFR-AT-0127]|nr:hypothetical protein BKA66DRAFT_475097 [Pyrenochaeta sp. MPI-SDFR-AT-0127]